MDWHGALLGLLGGVMIGLSGAVLLFFNGQIAGIAGIFSGILRPVAGEWVWRGLFVAGLLAGGLLAFGTAPGAFAVEVQRPWPLLAAAGVLVGFGTRLGSGCTSGHGVCGIARFSLRSWVATGTFTATGAASVFVLQHLLGG